MWTEFQFGKVKIQEMDYNENLHHKVGALSATELYS